MLYVQCETFSLSVMVPQGEESCLVIDISIDTQTHTQVVDAFRCTGSNVNKAYVYICIYSYIESQFVSVNVDVVAGHHK